MVSRYRVLLIATNVEREPYPVYPIGAAIIARALEDADIAVSGLDFAFLDDPVGATTTAIADCRPDLVGISVRAVDTTCSLDPRSYLDPVADLVAEIRSVSTAPVVVGGSGYSLFPELILSRLGADYGVVGEGEETIVDLIGELRATIDPTGLPGLMVRHDSEIVGTRRRSSSPVDRWKAPATDVFPLRPHLRAGGMASVQTKRGCPMSCTYCTYPNLEGVGFRLRDPGDVAVEVAALVEDGVEYLFFVDNNFNLPSHHATGVCRRLAALHTRPEWTAFLTPHDFSGHLAELMAAAGARSVEFGSESAAEAVLQGLGKHHSAEDILRCDHRCAEAGVTPAHYFIFGGPGETSETVEESLELIGNLRGPVVAMFGIRVYPDTVFHRRAMVEGLISPEDQLLEPAYYFSPLVDPDAMLARLMDFSSTKRNFVVLGNEDGFNKEFIGRLRQHGRKGPLWEFMR